MQVEIPELGVANILVVGDVMLDRYWSGITERISPEAPVPVVHVGQIEERPGGAANVAINLASLGMHVQLVGLVGEDREAKSLQNLLETAGVEQRLVSSKASRTVTKLRVLSRNQQLLRLDFEMGFSGAEANQLNLAFESALARSKIVVASDYGKGALLNLPRLIGAANKLKVPVVVDPKGTNYERYRGAWAITPNRAEFEAVVGRCYCDRDIVERGEALRQDLRLGALLITRGAEGMTLLLEGATPLHLPTHAQEVIDVTGAGDTVIAAFAAGIANELTATHAAQLANLAAGLVVAKVGSASVTQSELRWAAHQSRLVGLVEDELLELVRAARAQGERIVMTNGCFDLLHAGHVSYLAKARSLGDRLIVAVNDDGSVRRLKGEGRPINALSDRIAVLSALESVDWVVAFSDDTPLRLIKLLRPDVLVKGGDYAIEDIVGADEVMQSGGEVQAIPILEGRSTTTLLARIRERK